MNGGSILLSGRGGGDLEPSQGGSINLSAPNDDHSNGGNIILTGGSSQGCGGTLNMSGGNGSNGGTINASGGDNGNGGSINISDGGGSITSIGVNENEAGSLNMSANIYSSGGSINTSGGAGQVRIENDEEIHFGGAGGSINTSNGGGSIDTRGVGSIELGITGTRTTLVGSASGTNKTITLPNATGTIALSTPLLNFDLYATGVDIGRSTAWSQQMTIPSDILELLNGSPAIVTDIACIITNRSGTGNLFFTPPSFQLVSGGTSPTDFSYTNSLSIGVKPQIGNYSRTSNGVGSGNSDGKYTYGGGTLFIQSSTLPVYLSTALTSAMTISQTTMAMGSVAGSGFSSSNTYVKIDNEIVLITANGTGFAPTIVRGQLGTTPATHVVGSTVSANIGSAGGGLLAKICYTFKRFV